MCMRHLSPPHALQREQREANGVLPSVNPTINSNIHQWMKQVCIEWTSISRSWLVYVLNVKESAQFILETENQCCTVGGKGVLETRVKKGHRHPETPCISSLVWTWFFFFPSLWCCGVENARDGEERKQTKTWDIDNLRRRTFWMFVYYIIVT